MESQHVVWGLYRRFYSWKITEVAVVLLETTLVSIEDSIIADGGINVFGWYSNNQTLR